jgi:hypothetical protein
VYAVHILINSIWNKEDLSDQWKESIIVPVLKRSDGTDCNNYRGISVLSTSFNILSNIRLSRLNPYVETFFWGGGTFSLDFHITAQLRIRFYTFVGY